MATQVRRAEREDIPNLLALIQALADYEKLPGPDRDAQERMRRHGWPENSDAPHFTAWLAEVGEEKMRAVGYAITFLTYSSFLARPTFYIEDIFVLPDRRGQGAGLALFNRLQAEAEAIGCGRMEWVVLDWNTSAQEFYRKRGAEHLKEWHVYRLTLAT